MMMIGAPFLLHIQKTQTLEQAHGGFDQLLSQQIQKSVEHDDMKVAAVLKEIGVFLKKNSVKAFAFNGKNDIII